MAERIAIGGDFGGGHIAVAAIDERGAQVGDFFRRDIVPNWPAVQICDVIAECVKTALTQLPSGLKVVGAGFGSPGPLDFDSFTLLDTPNLPTLQNFPMGKALASRTGLKIIANNDANTYVFGEAMYGAGKGYNIVYGCTLGTGFGHGLVVNGRIFGGAHGMAMEHARSPYLEGTIEDRVSGRGIRMNWIQLSGQDTDIISAKEISDFTKIGNQTDQGLKDQAANQSYVNAAFKVYHRFGKDLGFALAWVCNCLDPDIIVLGGNIAKDSILFRDPMMETLQSALPAFTRSKIKVVVGQLGELATIKGGAALAFQKFCS